MRTGASLALLFTCLVFAACDSDGAAARDAGIDAAVVPECPANGQVFDDYATCGSCTQVHGEGECASGYVCTCALTCTWWVHGFPFDGGIGCGGIDAGLPDASGVDASAF